MMTTIIFGEFRRRRPRYHHLLNRLRTGSGSTLAQIDVHHAHKALSGALFSTGLPDRS